MKKILLDTNAYSAFLAGDEKVFAVLSQAEEVLISVFVLSELYYGFKNGSREDKNREILNKFIAKPTVKIINTSSETADFFAMIKLHLKTNGTPIPLNDVWIASHAMETSAILITYDKHFQKIPNLRIW